MTRSDFSRNTLVLCATVVLLAGCGGSQLPIATPGVMPQSLTQSARNAYSGPLLYVANEGDERDVTVYPAKAKDPSPIETISDGLNQPGGLCLDGQGTLYVVDESGWVAEYPAGKKKPSRIITDGINVPSFCAIDGDGNLWVTNSYGPNVTEYLKGSTKPHTVITKGLTYPDGIAFDHAGNMYVGNPLPPHRANVQVFAPGSKSPSRTITDSIYYPIGLTVDAHGTLYVTSDRKNNVEEYRFGQNHPYRTITDEMGNAVAVTVEKNGFLYVTTYNTQFEVVELRPGSITPLHREISKGLWDSLGTAYSPPLLP